MINTPMGGIETKTAREDRHVSLDSAICNMDGVRDSLLDLKYRILKQSTCEDGVHEPVPYCCPSLAETLELAPTRINDQLAEMQGLLCEITALLF